MITEFVVSMILVAALAWVVIRLRHDWRRERHIRNRLGFSLLVIIGLAAPVFAQSHPDVVAAVKAQLQARGVDLSGPCGAFQITKRVAWNLRAEGAGVVDKPSGEGCEGRSKDVIVYTDGRQFDILIDSGGANSPSWQPVPVPPDPTRWRAVAADPDAGSSAPAPPPVIPPVPVPPLVIDLAPVLQGIAELKAQNDAQTATLKAAIDAPGWFTKFMSNPVVLSVLAATGTCLSTQCWRPKQ